MGEPSRPGRRAWLPLGLAVAACLGVIVWALVRLDPTRNLTGEEWARIAYLLGFIVLVSSSLLARGLQLGQSVRYGLIWLAIVAVLLAGFAFRHEAGHVLRRMAGELTPGRPIATGPQEMAVAQHEDGHFYLTGAVNGTPVRFLVDTGASGIALSRDDARRLGVDMSTLAFTRQFETANGVGRGAPFVAVSLAVGPIRMSRVAMSINEAPLRTSLLGLSYLRELDSYEVRGGRLYLRWRP